LRIPSISVSWPVTEASGNDVRICVRRCRTRSGQGRPRGPARFRAHPAPLPTTAVGT
jgi:hypothetical protein